MLILLLEIKIHQGLEYVKLRGNRIELSSKLLIPQDLKKFSSVKQFSKIQKQDELSEIKDFYNFKYSK